MPEYKNRNHIMYKNLKKSVNISTKISVISKQMHENLLSKPQYHKRMLRYFIF